jgi:hypothetical protein
MSCIPSALLPSQIAAVCISFIHMQRAKNAWVVQSLCYGGGGDTNVVAVVGGGSYGFAVCVKDIGTHRTLDRIERQNRAFTRQNRNLDSNYMYNLTSHLRVTAIMA